MRRATRSAGPDGVDALRPVTLLTHGCACDNVQTLAATGTVRRMIPQVALLTEGAANCRTVVPCIVSMRLRLDSRDTLLPTCAEPVTGKGPGYSGPLSGLRTQASRSLASLARAISLLA